MAIKKPKPSRKKTYSPTNKPKPTKKNSRPSSKKQQTFNPAKQSNVSSCLKQCETVYPKKKAGCRKKCYDKNFSERPKKNQTHKKLHPSKNPSRKKPKTLTPVNKHFFSSCLKQCETVHVKKKRGCRKKCRDKNVTESPKNNKNDKKSNPTKKS